MDNMIGIIIINSESIPIRSTLDASISTNYAAHIMSLATKARSAVRNLDPQNDLTFLRIRSKKHEILVAPEKVRHFVICMLPLAPVRPSCCG